MIHIVRFQSQSFTILQAILILSFRVKKLGAIESVINNELQHLFQWLRDKKLSLNETKTEPIIFRLPWKQLPREPDIGLNNCKLRLHTHVKYLGIFIDEIVSWKKQTDIFCSKLSRANGIVSKLRLFAPLKTCLSVYYPIFYSHPLHDCPAWSCTKEINY